MESRIKLKVSLTFSFENLSWLEKVNQSFLSSFSFSLHFDFFCLALLYTRKRLQSFRLKSLGAFHELFIIVINTIIIIIKMQKRFQIIMIIITCYITNTVWHIIIIIIIIKIIQGKCHRCQVTVIVSNHWTIEEIYMFSQRYWALFIYLFIYEYTKLYIYIYIIDKYILDIYI